MKSIKIKFQQLIFGIFSTDTKKSVIFKNNGFFGNLARQIKKNLYPSCKLISDEDIKELAL
jgi:hypothetical protein